MNMINYAGKFDGSFEFEVEHRKVVVHKKYRKLPFEKWKGYLGRFKTQELINEIR